MPITLIVANENRTIRCLYLWNLNRWGYFYAVKCTQYGFRYLITKTRRNCISYHLVCILYVIVLEDEVIGESLYSSTFAYTQPSILAQFVLLEVPILMTEVHHLWRRRMQWSKVGCCIYSEGWLLPTSSSVASIIK